jgi:nitroreductase
MMDFETLINTRQSCRNFDPSKEVAREDVNAVLEAARLAPSANNAQPMHFTVCTKELAKDIAVSLQYLGLNKFAVNASCFIVVSETSRTLVAAAGSKLKRQDWRSVDIGIAVSYLTLGATSRGLSTCIVGAFDEKKLKNLLGIKERIRLVVVLGYAMEGDPLRPKRRKSLDEIADFR